MKICLNIIATGRYTYFLENVISTARANFFKGSQITYLIHTDSDFFEEKDGIRINKIEFEPWPNPTLKRFHYFLSAENILREHDFCFYIDVDSSFSNSVDIPLDNVEGIISTLHPGYYGTSGTPERNSSSEAYIPEGSKNRYFCGGFFGGKTEDFIIMSREIKKNIDKDLENSIIAVWHDESHLNHYLFNNPPKFILGNYFAISQNQSKKFPNSPIVFLDKNHYQMRNIIP